MTYRVAMAGACPYPVPQGSQVLLRDTALALHYRGHEVCLVVYGHGDPAGASEPGPLRVYRAARIPGARRTAAGPSLAKPLHDLALVRALRRAVRDNAVEVVHAHNYEALLAALAAGHRPLVYHAHNAMADELPYFIAGSGWFGAWLDRWLPRRADHVIAPHARLADYLAAEGCPRERITVVPPCIDVDLFEPGPVSTETPPVLYTGNLDRYQNLELLAHAMALVRRQCPRARLLVATAAPGTVPGAERVPTPGFDALRQVLAQDAVVACPRVSWSGYPIKLLNAMAAGKAAVACESAAYPLTSGQTGLIVPDNDAEAFAAALLRLIGNPTLRSSLGRNAREAVAVSHAPIRVAEALENLYAKLLRREP